MKSAYLAVFTFSLSWLMPECVGASESVLQKGVIEGKITDIGRLPLSGVEIRLARADSGAQAVSEDERGGTAVTTNGQGKYLFKDVESGAYKLSVVGSDGSSISASRRDVFVPKGGTVSVPFQLPSLAAVSFRFSIEGEKEPASFKIDGQQFESKELLLTLGPHRIEVEDPICRYREDHIVKPTELKKTQQITIVCPTVQ